MGEEDFSLARKMETNSFTRANAGPKITRMTTTYVSRKAGKDKRRIGEKLRRKRR
jgi:hypothetical protein